MRIAFLTLLINVFFSTEAFSIPAACIPGQQQFAALAFEYCDGSNSWSALGEPTAPAVPVSCTGSTGKQRMNGASMEYCNGTNWISLNCAVTASTCTGSLGKQKYITARGGMMQFCNGNFWVDMAGGPTCGGATLGVIDNFDNWTGGIPNGWTTPPSDGSLAQSSLHTSDGGSSVEGYREVRIQKTIDLTGKSTIKLDINFTNCTGGVPQGWINIDSTYYAFTSIGTMTVDVTSYTGNKNVILIVGGEYNPVSCTTWVDKMVVQ